MMMLPARRWAEEFLTDIRKERKEDEAYKQAKKQEEVMDELPLKDRKVKELGNENRMLY